MVVMMVMVLVSLMLHVLHLLLQRVAVHRGLYLHAVELAPRRGDEAGGRVELAQKLARRDDLALGRGVGAAHDDDVRVLDLIVEKLAEVAHVHAAFARVHNGHFRADGRALDLLHSARNIAELAHAGRLDDDAVGRVLVHDLLERLFKVAHEGAADTAGVHLGDLHAGVLEEAAVNGNLAELVLYQHKLLALVRLRDELADERCLPRTEKAGKYVYSGHGKTSM